MLSFHPLLSAKENSNYQYNEGPIFGTSYHIKYKSSIDFHRQIDSTLNLYNASISSYQPQSLVCRINRNDTAVTLNHWFETLFNVSKEVSIASGGAYDITVAPLIEAWGFSYKKKLTITPQLIDSLRKLVGYQKVKIENGYFIKADPRMMIDMSGSGDGYASDVIAELLDSKNITDYMVEIGGEIRVKGVSPSQKKWSIGIDKPVDSKFSQEIKQVVHISNCALSTSGNYRNYYIENGKKYAHTIDPVSGYPVQHSLLSATIIAPTCIEADTYSTACMVLGLEKSLEMIKRNPALEGYFIFSNKKGKMSVMATKGFKKYFGQ